jgi:SAM-dependent methyltransferase
VDSILATTRQTRSEQEEGRERCPIQAHPTPQCYLCGALGNLLYEGQRDRLFQAPGSWNVRVCANTDCRLMWLDPMPNEKDIGRAYEKYYTHEVTLPQGLAFKRALQRLWRLGVVPILSVVNPIHRERKKLSMMYAGKKPGKILDVGCGDGSRLARFKDLGWEVFGQELDPKAALRARETFGIDVHVGSLASSGLPEMSFDWVVMNHVIEHVHDPVELLRQCRRLLRKGGNLVLITPNSKSTGHKHFGAYWRGLEPPRHIFIFSQKTLAAAAEKAGLSVFRSWTTAANAYQLAFDSLTIKRHNLPFWLLPKVLRRCYAIGFQYYSSVLNILDSDSGEECALHLMS